MYIWNEVKTYTGMVLFTTIVQGVKFYKDRYGLLYVKLKGIMREVNSIQHGLDLEFENRVKTIRGE